MEPVYELSNSLCHNQEVNDWLETLRGVCESDKTWKHRRDFILRNVHAFCGNLSQLPSVTSNHRGLDQLLAYSMVWTNHVFTACRYPNSVMEKALKMAETIKVTDAPVHKTRDELFSQMKRGNSSTNDGVVEPCKKTKANQETSSSNNAKTVEVKQPNLSHDVATQKTNAKTGQIPSNCKTPGTPVYAVNIPTESKLGSEAPSAKKSLLECKQTTAKEPLQPNVSTVKGPHRLTAEDTKERQTFFNRLYKTVAWKLVAAGGFNLNLNHGDLLSTCIESQKSTLDITFVPLKELADLPQTKASQENIVCELRCKSVYLGMGCGKTKENAKAVACREVLKLFLKKKVVVRICKRKYNGCEVEDLVLLDDESRPVNLPPALKNPQELI